MCSIIYVEEKVLTRNAFKLVIEKQEDCKVLYSALEVLKISEDTLLKNQGIQTFALLQIAIITKRLLV